MSIQNLTLILHLVCLMNLDGSKEVIYLRDKYKQDGGKVYWNKTCKMPNTK